MDIAEAKRTLDLLIKTPAGTVPLMQDFGIDWNSIIDLPTESAKAVLTAEIVEKAKKYIPEISITSIECIIDLEGNIKPKILFELSDCSEDDEQEDIEETDEETEAEDYE